MRDYAVLIFILSLPFLAALTHDIYVAYDTYGDEWIQYFHPSDLGWVWTQYAADSHDQARDSFGPDLWIAFVLPVLQQKTMFIAAIPLLIFGVVHVIMWVTGKGPYEGRGLMAPSVKKSKGTERVSARPGNTKFKYKRK